MRRIGVLLMCLGLLAGCRQVNVAVPKAAPQHFSVPAGKPTAQAEHLNTFMKADFVEASGVVTSLGGARVSADQASGRDYLAESLGLWLLHLVMTRQYQAFRTFYAAGKAKLYNGQNFSYRLTRPQNKRSNVNASVDDLRIMRALLAYDEATHSNHYRKQAATLYARWAQGCLPNGQLRDFYDVKAHKATTQASLAYFDLQTLRYFSTKKQQYRQLVAVLQHGYLGDALPLYASSYDWGDGAYSSKTLNTSEALETLLQLARVGRLKATTKAWLVQRLQTKQLPNAMTITGGIADVGQSVANWALLAQIFATQHDRQHYEQTMALIWQQQVTQGALAGGFGVRKTGAAYSYNNLNVLLAADVRGQAYAD